VRKMRENENEQGLRTFGSFIKRWVNGVHPASRAYVRLTLKMIFFFKLLGKFARHRKVKNNKVSQNNFISEIRGTVKILFVYYSQPQSSRHQNSPLLRVRET
jgi:hypothetical protein